MNEHKCNFPVYKYDNCNKFFSKLIVYIGMQNFIKYYLPESEDEKEIFKIDMNYNTIMTNIDHIVNIISSIEIDGMVYINSDTNLNQVLELSNINITDFIPIIKS